LNTRCIIAADCSFARKKAPAFAGAFALPN